MDKENKKMKMNMKRLKMIMMRIFITYDLEDKLLQLCIFLCAFVKNSVSRAEEALGLIL